MPAGAPLAAPQPRHGRFGTSRRSSPSGLTPPRGGEGVAGECVARRKGTGLLGRSAGSSARWDCESRTNTRSWRQTCPDSKRCKEEKRRAWQTPVSGHVRTPKHDRRCACRRGAEEQRLQTLAANRWPLRMDSARPSSHGWLIPSGLLSAGLLTLDI